MRSAILVSGALLSLIYSVPQAEAAERQLEAHLHGHGTLNVALEGQALWMELEAPGADIVGFEHPASSDEDKAAIVAAKDQLSDPLALFTLPAAADCRLDEATVELEQSEAGGDEDGHEHGEEDHDAHGHEDDEDHDAHGHDEEGDHDDHGHDEEGHEDHAEASHSAFHAEYLLTCAQPSAIDEIGFPYFDLFAGAEALDVSVITDQGQGHYEVAREQPSLRLTGQ